VLASNHVGYLDFTFIGYGARAQGRLVRFLAKKEVFEHKLAGPLMRGMRHIPVDRFGHATESLHVALDALRRGQVIGMFPEATISRSFVPRAGKTGAARMAMAAGAPLVPSAVWGSQRLLTKGRPRNFQRGVAISVAYGEPIHYEPDDDPTEVTKRLMEAIGELVEELWTTYPQQPAGEADRWWLPAHLGGTAPTMEEAEELAARERAERKARRRAERARE
jgi:1-acyl-sn-glycerol-3-phosphate acyltransferase